MITYQDAGVDIQKGADAVSRIKKHVATTYNNNVLTHIGGFGSAFSIKDIAETYDHPVLVQSMDGVGTKIIVARMANLFYGLGHDLLSACANDIVVMGAKPLTILDYIASESLDNDAIESMIHGLSDACKENDVALVGGEMAQMPDTYCKNEWDFVGIVTGVVEKEKMITGEKINVGDVVIALTSSGLHTNGFSLARKLLFDSNNDYFKTEIIDTLLAPHINYTKPVHDLLNHSIDIHGMAHITGGGIWDNIPRILPTAHFKTCAPGRTRARVTHPPVGPLPLRSSTSCRSVGFEMNNDGLSVEIKRDSWPMPPIFKQLVAIGDLDERTAYHTFNMGIGFVIILSKTEWEKARLILNKYTHFQACLVGTVAFGNQTVRLV